MVTALWLLFIFGTALIVALMARKHPITPRPPITGPARPTQRRAQPRRPQPQRYDGSYPFGRKGPPAGWMAQVSPHRHHHG
jgi:hypothetical protein